MVESCKGPHERERSASKRLAPTPAATETMDEFVVTPATHDVVNVERLGRAGQRQELSEQESAELAGGDELDDVLRAVQEAYEAGVAQGLDQDDDGDEADEDLVILELLLDRPVGSVHLAAACVAPCCIDCSCVDCSGAGSHTRRLHPSRGESLWPKDRKERETVLLRIRTTDPSEDLS